MITCGETDTNIQGLRNKIDQLHKVIPGTKTTGFESQYRVFHFNIMIYIYTCTCTTYTYIHMYVHVPTHIQALVHISTHDAYTWTCGDVCTSVATKLVWHASDTL